MDGQAKSPLPESARQQALHPLHKIPLTMRIAFLTTDQRESIRGCNEPQPRIGHAPGALLQGFDGLDGAEVHIVSCLKEPLPSVKAIAPNIFYHGVAVPKIGWLRTGYQGCIRAVRKKLREIQPDIVHGQGSERDCAISAAFSGFPNVITIHGNMRSIARVNHSRPFSFLWLAARLEGFVLPRTDGVVCITNYTRNLVKNLARRTWVLPNAVDKGYFGVEAVPDKSAPPVGLCVGTIYPLKNQNAFIRALDPLAKEKQFKIIFAGEVARNDYGEKFQQLVRDRQWCQHIGFLSREQLRTQLATASFVVLPTLEDNCPMVVLEAMAAGVPVLASKVGGVPDLIEPEKNGLFCDPSRPESFREGVERILADRQWTQQLAANAQAEALRRFHPRVIAEQHLEIYRDVLQKG
jgi:glycosyltransferase involved in cell wall biosynthesis